MQRRAHIFGSVLFAASVLVTGAAQGQQPNDAGALTLQATVSGYVDLSSGGQATLTGGSGATISGNTNKGDRLSGMTLSFGDVSPVNPSSFVRAIVPIRLRSNIGYVLSVSTAGFTSTDPLALQAADVGFGIGAISRNDTGVNSGGQDTPVAAVLGDPSLDMTDADPATPRWDFKPEKSLASFTTARAVLSGDRIMRVVPASVVGGLTLNTYFVIKPQFFSPGAFTTTVTFTISTP